MMLMTRHNPIISAGTRAWMNKILTALELERDTIQYGDLDIPAMEAYIKHPADPDSSNPAGLYVAAANVYLNSTSKIVSEDRLEETGSIFLVDIRTDIIIGHQAPAITRKQLNEFGSGMYGRRTDPKRKNELSIYDNYDNTDIQMSSLISSIAEYITQQAASTEEIAHRIEQITSVVQSNAATAEANAASEEPLSQTAMLNEMGA